jgi:sodium/hydrogen antiporter
LRLLAELTLAMVLFTDAVNADLGVVRRNLGLPERRLLIGLPLTIVLGFLLAAIVFPSLDTLEIALLAAMLAPTDAAIGKPVVTGGAAGYARVAQAGERSQRRPLRADRGAAARAGGGGTHIEGEPMVHVARVVVEEIGIGLIFGLVLSWLATMMLRFAERHGWISEHWVEVPIVALAAACFATAQAAGGSAFIACFVGGLLPSGLGARHKEELLRGAEHTGEALALLTWFGPRGLATIAFAVLVLDEKLPGNDAMMLAAGWTVLLSVIAHGVTRQPAGRGWRGARQS